ncbi:protein-tyrosine-phosphatase [Caerostris darwini]|uniref:Protein-tyrosine-phosphatase n=1 Tax=Caerostris darwini TaxID=1538125 RepID=A0AAV4X2P4_9ARAC|nr:protein-tyrosine-phosphatase [Caerostris darwini]
MLPPSSQQFLKDIPVSSKMLYMPERSGLKRFGAFQCKSVKQNITSHIVTLKLPPLNLAELEAVLPYNVANLGESIELEVKVMKRLELPIRWAHDGKPMSNWSGLLKVRLESVTPENSGIYECFYGGRRRMGVHALMKVYVRIACGNNRFGADCDKFCSHLNSSSNSGELCRKFIFCKPDPYGCSCAPGFKGPNCEEQCESGFYGADCKQRCHCAYGDRHCNSVTGFCEVGCARGWEGYSCEIEGKPHINAITNLEIHPGTDVSVSCAVDSVSKPEINVLSNDFPHLEVILRNLEANRHEAVINLKPEMTGIYVFLCTAENEVGFDTKKIVLNVVDPDIQTAAISHCPLGTYGTKCKNACHCAENDYCDIISGRCSLGCEDGWEGPTCGICRRGWYGNNCEHTCHCRDGHEDCDEHGFCLSGCEPGWSGFTCQIKCIPGRFGPNCAETCRCPGYLFSVCDRVTGECRRQNKPHVHHIDRPHVIEKVSRILFLL